MFYSHNEDELMAYGYRLGRKLQAGDVLVLTGNLGAGKTTLTKGIAKGLDIDQMIKSPTYTIVREYEGRLPLYHLDVYRIGNDPDSIDLDDFLYGDGVAVIEWGELLEEDLLGDYLEIIITPSGDGRDIELQSNGPRSKELSEAIERG
ncbi:MULTISPECIES: tRNA (adenosine(37)-N6)-threonylcarbamoyltransferase complex ATPase subunit type 1 TsaE [Streptococcus]|jgi:tRNA threonylcarbamoyladenosine biosynthesis protein TsaE|uniref:tRNA threonylcarbamoyladenosine biosynthesis protein TsaE n=2 Tax=Streptococcus TaxID=1301 RepID=A0A1H9D7D7_STREI|nr:MULTISPECIES: tRNA (adenosine(37)-N6)-threonylcarbamoyltransferase complex ATPase subunit type 1 TsaE [Streptococcus]MDY2776115.1 tRNA (adenosine(37)-N6)-threonylcarbamoyltransferase complex ATPase subunit type 1 TsaE [Streptococcus infantarius]MEE1325528.1 tRNA (adenosine(37)-N6)-threonylcarbamoyltransferase complex ATPase subunit type 1 TsaE [Streptococcus sp.]QGX00120.1 tRNA (adenosine(37)-N6)-threonylcarbamoyltransferase complex ATPase subunit type 1 TsaE [Streptococcus ruminicola]QIM466